MGRKDYMRGEYREAIRNSVSSAIDDVESSVNGIIEKAEQINADNLEEMKAELISDLQDLSYKLY